ncbi:ABC transporter permease, partial [Staphylococcus felis]
MKLFRVKAVIYKDFKEILRNPSLYFMIIMPILLALYFKFLSASLASEGSTESFNDLLVYIIIAFSLTMPLGCITISILAEENEKGTLQSLIETPLKPVELLLGKAFLGTVSSLITSVISLIALGIPFNIQWHDYLSLLLYIAMIICFALGFGLITKTIGQSAFFIFIVLILSMTLFVEIFKSANVSNILIYLLN